MLKDIHISEFNENPCGFLLLVILRIHQLLFINVFYISLFVIETNLNGPGSTNYPLTSALFKTPEPTPRERERDRELISLQLVMQQIKLDNDNLRRQLQQAKENSDAYR